MTSGERGPEPPERCTATGPDVALGDVVEEEEALADARGTIRAGKLAGRSMSSAILILAAPVFLQQLLAAFVGLTDKVLAGSLPAEVRLPAMDAIGIGSYVGWFIGIAMAGLGIGGQALVARAIGGGDVDLARRSAGQALGLCVAWGVLVGILLWISAPLAAQVCRLSTDATVHYRVYVGALAPSLPFAAIMMVGAMALHGAGETTKPALIAAAVNVVNVAFSWMLSGVDIAWEGFALENPFAFDLGVRGIALGTAIGYASGAFLTWATLARGVRDLRVRLVDLRIDRGLAWRVVRIGVPNFFEGIAMWSVNLFVLAFIGQIALRQSEGEGMVGAHVIAVQWEAFSFLPGFAIGTAAGALAGQYLGAGNERLARRAILACTGIAVVLMGGLGILFITAGEALTRLVSREPVHLETVPKLLAICGAIQVFFATTMVIRQGLRGVGDAKWTFAITTLSSYGVRLPAAWILGVHLDLGLPGVWLALCGELVVRAVLFSARFVHGGWARISV